MRFSGLSGCACKKYVHRARPINSKVMPNDISFFFCDETGLSPYFESGRGIPIPSRKAVMSRFALALFALIPSHASGVCFDLHPVFGPVVRDCRCVCFNGAAASGVLCTDDAALVCQNCEPSYMVVTDQAADTDECVSTEPRMTGFLDPLNNPYLEADTGTEDTGGGAKDGKVLGNGNDANGDIDGESTDEDSTASSTMGGVVRQKCPLADGGVTAYNTTDAVCTVPKLQTNSETSLSGAGVTWPGAIYLWVYLEVLSLSPRSKSN